MLLNELLFSTFNEFVCLLTNIHFIYCVFNELLCCLLTNEHLISYIFNGLKKKKKRIERKKKKKKAKQQKHPTFTRK